LAKIFTETKSVKVTPDSVEVYYLSIYLLS